MSKTLKIYVFTCVLSIYFLLSNSLPQKIYKNGKFCLIIPSIMFLNKVFLQKFNALLDATVRVQPNANGVRMQSTICRLCLDLIHYGIFILQNFSNKYVTVKIDMCAVVALMKYHQINVSLEI